MHFIETSAKNDSILSTAIYNILKNEIMTKENQESIQLNETASDEKIRCCYR